MNCGALLIRPARVGGLTKVKRSIRSKSMVRLALRKLDTVARQRCRINDPARPRPLRCPDYSAECSEGEAGVYTALLRSLAYIFDAGTRRITPKIIRKMAHLYGFPELEFSKLTSTVYAKKKPLPHSRSVERHKRASFVLIGFGRVRPRRVPYTPTDDAD